MPAGKFPFKSTAAGLTLTPLKLDHKYVRVQPVDDATFAGRFDDSGALSVLDHTVPYPYTLTAAPGRGSYSVKDHTLLFSYDDGRRFPVAFPGIATRSPTRPPRPWR